jgi:hypothetical protein
MTRRCSLARWTGRKAGVLLNKSTQWLQPQTNYVVSCTSACPAHLAQHQLDRAKDDDELLQSDAAAGVEGLVQRLQHSRRDSGGAEHGGG